MLEGSRRSRTVVNYAETAGGGAGGLKTGDLILQTLVEHERPNPNPNPIPNPSPNPNPNPNPNPKPNLNLQVEHDPGASHGVSLLELAEG